MTRLPIADAKTVRTGLLRQIRRRPGPTLTALAATAAAALAGLAPARIIGILVDRVLAGTTYDELVRLLIWTAVALAAGALLTGLAAALTVRAGQLLLAAVREDALDAALHLPTDTIEEAGRGDLLSRISDDVGIVAETVTNLLAVWVSSAVVILLTVAGLATLDPWLALAGCATVPVYVFALRRYLPRAVPLYAEQRVAFADRAETILSTLSGLATIGTYRAEPRFVASIDASSERARDISRRALWFVTGWVKWLNIAELVGLSAIIATGFLLVDAGTTTAGAVTTAALYFHRLFGPLGVVVMSVDDVQSAIASLARILGLGTVPGRARQTPAPPPAGPATVEISGLHHTYDANPVLHGIDLRIAAGERVALVGASGAGKTTLAGIVAGTLTPTAGTVDVRDPAGQRPRVILVAQEPHVFAGPLSTDLRLARPEATDQEITDALALVGADGWVRQLPDGVDTRIGPGHTQLDDEQRAQVALARAHLAAPSLVILDEATAESGSHHADVLERAAERVCAGRTALVIAHRLGQAARADRVVVMEHGRVVEEGTHDDLLARGGPYAHLWAAWKP
ncbi:ABC transporter ATP-binding protein [Polymorphospora sp. NPDC050346]|uniref:ABC transporter ATP-binding protein n=1 Tax=Polymorphospora sp. NPDC050346 TaxID=3155780 RepID=UPI0034033C87